MATFCINCGSPLNAGVAFCPQCGKPTGAVPNPAPQATNQTYAAPASPAAKGGSGAKILIIVLCFLVLGGVAVVGTLFWAAHRVKQAIVEKAEENGVDLHSLGKTGGASNQPLPKACELLSKEDAAKLIGEPVERAEAKDDGCEYYGPPGLSAKLAQDAAKSAVEPGKAPKDATNAAIDLQGMLTRAGAQAGNSEAGSTGSGGELPLLVVGFSADGKAAMGALKFSKAIFGAATKAVANSQGENTSGDNKIGADVFIGTDVAGLGDKAMWSPHYGLCVLKGDTLMKVTPGLFPDFRDKSFAVARAVLPKI